MVALNFKNATALFLIAVIF